MKRNLDSDSTTNMTKRYRPQDMSLRLMIGSRVAGGVIGKGGANINRLREQHSATISIPDTLGPERVINIGADRDVTLKVVEDLFPSLEDVPGRDPDATDSEIRMLVNTTQAGCIIGRSGFKIKELREETGAQIRVFTEPCPMSSDRVALISGTRDKILHCLKLVLALLDENPPKGRIAPYDPANYDELYASEYGGFADGRGRGMSGGMRGGGGYGMPRGGGGYGMPRGGGYGMPPRGGPMGGRGFPGRGGFGGRGGGHMPHGGMDFNAPMSGSDSLTPLQGGNGDDGGQETQQFSIPKAAAGAIIGKGGARIRQIRGDSGAQISIDDAKDGAAERIITIQGSTDQVQLAHFLLQKSVRENSGPDGY